MRPVTVYTSETCTLCHSVENLFDVREIPYEKVVLLEDSEEHHALIERSGMATLPQVFVGNLLVGGYQETLAADQSGMLTDLLAD